MAVSDLLPIVTIVDPGEARESGGFARALADLGWQVQVVGHVADALGARDAWPAVVVLAAGEACDVAALRAGGGVAASVPVLGPASGDGAFDPALSDAERAGQVDLWKPDAAAATVARLETVFGREEIRGILGRFRAMLVEALATLERGEAAMLAHRLAGMAGTVGFATVGRAWNAVSDGAPVDAVALHRDTRVAIATIDRILLSD